MHRSLPFSILAVALTGVAFAQTMPVAPAPPTLPPAPVEARAAHLQALAARGGPCSIVQATATINGILYIGCNGGGIVALNGTGHVLGARALATDHLSAILPAGSDAIAVLGANDGATLRNSLAFLRARTLADITPTALTDATYLGMFANRAFVDDWCCFGRPDAYRPATFFCISMKNGTRSPPFDLAPEPQAHPANEQPLGQGEHNYLIGSYFYVVVGPVTYRYDLWHLSAEPMRMTSFAPGL